MTYMLATHTQAQNRPYSKDLKELTGWTKFQIKVLAKVEGICSFHADNENHSTETSSLDWDYFDAQRVYCWILSKDE